tara:strand:- start:450 stop:824 length:375 start_codon:yes stop_codon:yes gene_type:complete
MKEHLPLNKDDTFRLKVGKIAVKVINLLAKKNEQYGDSAFDPMRFFSDLGPDAGLRVRIDDKLSRLMRGNDTIESDIDVIEDLIGYFILLRLTMEEYPEDEISEADLRIIGSAKNKFHVGGEQQ